MKLSNLTVTGFRSFKQISWSPTNLNLIIGPNGSGKSNLLKFFDLLRQSADGDLEDHILREGGFERLLWDGQVDAIDTSLHFSPAQEEHDIFPEDMVYHLLLKKTGFAGDYQIGMETLETPDITHADAEPFRYLQRTLSNAIIQSKNTSENLLYEDIKPKETLLSQSGSPYTKKPCFFTASTGDLILENFSIP